MYCGQVSPHRSHPLLLRPLRCTLTLNSLSSWCLRLPLPRVRFRSQVPLALPHCHPSAIPHSRMKRQQQ